MDDVVQWLIAAACLAVTVALRAEIALLFVGSGILGILYYAVVRQRKSLPLPLLVAIPLVSGGQGFAPPILLQLLTFFLKAGALTFGSGLVIVPFLEKGLVQQTGWLDERQFLVAVAIGMLSPGPVVITATFVGYLVAGFWGSLISTLGIFLPSFILILIVAPVLIRHRANPYIQGFVKGAYAAAIGTILGAAVLLSRIAIGDWLTVAVALGSLAALGRWNVKPYLLVAVTAVIGLIAFPLINPTWTFVK
jgi:chromate transporter